MKAVILAGGQGSRLRPLTEDIPKPMVSVLGKPIMEHIVHHLTGFGIRDIVATLHYRPRPIRDHFGDGSEFNVNMHYTLETQPLGTAGSVKLGEKLLDETFLVIGGDALVDFDFGTFLQFHRDKGAKVSLCLTRVRDPGEFGIVITDEAGRVQRFLEKPGPSQVFSDTVNTGIYLIEPDILERIPVETKYDFASDLFPSLLADDVPIYGYVAEGYWSDIGSLEQLRQAHWDFLDGKVQLALPGNRIREGVWVGQGADLHPDAEIHGPCWFGDNVLVHGGARLGPYVMFGDSVEVNARASVSRSIIMRNSFIGEGADLRNCIVAPRNIIGEDCEIGADSVIGTGCRLGQRVVVKPGVMIWPDKQIDVGATVTENLVWESLSRPSIFGSRGISGVANLHVTPEFAAIVGKAFGSWVERGRRVAVSRDPHPFSRLIKRALVSGLLAVGVHVDDLEESTAPMTRFITGYGRGLAGGVHVRISDEQPEMAQIEMFDGQGLPLSRNIGRKVEATFHRADFPKVSMSRVGELRYPGRVFERYVDHLIEHMDMNALGRFSGQVIYHAEDGISARVLDDMLGRSGVINLRVGGGLEMKHVEQKAAAIAKLNHALGLVVYRGSEQLRLVDETGEMLSLERTVELLTAAFIRSGPAEEPVFLPADHPLFLSDFAEKHHRRAIVTRVEAASRLAEATEQASGSDWVEFTHYYLGYDALAAGLRLLEFLGLEQISLRDFERSIPASCRRHLVLSCPWEEMGRVMRSLSDLEHADTGAVPEGIRLRQEQGIVFVLPSADRPELLVTVEAEDMHALAVLVEQTHPMLQRMIG